MALAVAACNGRGTVQTTRAEVVPPSPEISFTSYDSPSLQFLPRGKEAPGWQLEEDPIVVPSSRLAMYLDQDAQHFERYEVVDVTIGKYSATDNDGFATVEIYRFPDFVKAFGAYSTRKEGPIRFLDIPNESFEARHSIHLWRGPFYVRTIGGSANGSEALRKLVVTVADRMPTAPSKPAVLNFLPVSTRVVNSERYSAQAAFGLQFLANSFRATFTTGGPPAEGLIIPAANKTAATKIVDAYRALYVHNGKLLDPVPNLGEDNFTAEDKYMGRTVVFRIDRFVIAFNGYGDRQKLVDLAVQTDQRILGSIRKQLVTADKAAARAGDQRQDETPAWARGH
ncbi:MAG: DUF6599 family protein [Thermoanaerobaculia bacterium]